MNARRLLRLSLLMVGIMLSAILAPVPVHAAGNLYIDPAGQAAQPAGSIVTYQVKVANMDPFNAWDIRISTTRLSLDPVNVSLASNVVGNPFSELVNCVNGGEGIPFGQPGDIGCNVQDGPGIVHSAADFLNFSPSGTNGLLFTMKFKAGSQDYSQVRFLDAIIVGAGVAVIHTSTEGSYGTLPGGIPTAEFSWRPVHPVAGDTISFNASLSHDDPSNSQSGIQDYQWDFGDASLAISTKTPYVDHGFSSIAGFGLIGNFTVTLTVTNQLGLLSAATHIVEVKLRPPLCKLGLSSIIVPNDCPTIKSAIDSIVPGGTIQVTRGSYNESLIVNKSLTLTGAGRDLTILRGKIESRAANVTLSGFTLIGSGDYFDPFRAVLNVRSPANTVSDVRVEGPVNIMDSPGTVMTSSVVDDSPLVYGPRLGLRIVNSANSIYRSNRFSELSISGENPKDYFLDMDQSNTVNGKPVFYALGVDNPRVPTGPGYLGFVDSSDIRISQVSMTKVGQGVLLVSTRHTVIDGLQATDAVDFVHMLNATDTVIENNVIDRATLAIFNSSITSIVDNTMTGGGIEIVGSNSSLVARNKISSPSNSYGFLYGSLLPVFGIGIGIIRSDHNRLVDNLVSDAQLGILVSDSTSNQFVENRVDASPLSRFTITSGLVVQNSPRNVFRNNHFIGLTTSLSVTSNHFGNCSSGYRCHLLQDYVQDIDASNTVDDEPIFYLVSRRDMTIPSSAAYIGIVNSENIRIPHANLSSSVDGILVVSSKNVMIENANLTIGNYGVWAWKTEGIKIMDSKIQFAIQADGLLLESAAGIYIEDSSQAKVSGNMITRWGIFTGIDMVNTTYSLVEGNFITHYLHAGIDLEHSTLNTFSRNTLIGTAAYDEIGIIDRADFNPITGVTGKPDHNLFVGNTITRNRLGMEPGVGSIIYHNNFIENLRQSGDANPPLNTWDNGSGQGNYWSDYKGQDLDHDGVGDTLVPHLGIDKYPLMTPWAPTGLVASLSGRGAWFGRANPDNSDDHHDQSLLARVRNNGQTSEWVDIVYGITSSTGSTMTIDTGPAWLAKGQSAILSTPFQGSPGAYTVKAELRFSSDAFLGWTNATTKSFMFKVSDEEISQTNPLVNSVLDS